MSLAFSARSKPYAASVADEIRPGRLVPCLDSVDAEGIPPKWYQNYEQDWLFENLTIDRMPSKHGIKSGDYEGQLRRPGEKLEGSTTQAGVPQETSSVSNQSENEKPPLPVVTADSNVSQASEEKPPEEAANSESDESKKVVLTQTIATSEGTKQLTENQEDTASSGNKSIKESHVDEPDETVKHEALMPEPTGHAVSKLSPHAAEFVPSSCNLVSAGNSTEFDSAPSPQEEDRPPLLRRKSNTPENELMNCVKDVLYGLTQSPGELHYYADTLVNMLKKWLSTLTSLREVVDVIFEYSVTEPNFQYIAARLCNLLSMEGSIVINNDEKFRSVLMNRCRDEHLNREASLQNPETLPRLLGFAMFEAELFCHYRPLGESQPLKVFHRGLLAMLKTLLQNHSEDCLKCIGKMLKMTGCLLDDPMFLVEGEERKEKVNKVFSDVEQLKKESKLSDSVKILLSQVLELRSTNWGFSGTEESTGEYSPHPANDECYISDYSLAMGELALDDDLAPVTNPEQWSEYYEDDGEETTLQHDTYKYYFPEHYNDEGYGNYLDDDPEYDDEIGEEFEKFLLEQELQ